ncbi:GTPBP1 family GTP-binding protein [Halobacterium salinarum]|uniref:GTP-binding protein homolog n=4 Tax=Halobacterium salinarum TaxID=2242 RepID=Q9HPE4_HALSA|nr:GTPBP1 family GTP-binding protein [Halobacterium salinarum]AAG19926.1 GTP-binding protein homolog [Halobacterium salinarum NRC-1]MBB6088932.1 elongation factor 1-alpha [Halobacterium salinarum]MDL0118678.1 GTP-binding protein [Halobacterium salinarum]MDL0137748.1 GTP-binding protein [Halobacterium salinarum]MDL0140852.1 GTP-binding protein [Halobacterium salinarum]
MGRDRARLAAALERGEQEGGSVEFKERFSRDIHLAEGRLESLTAQLRHRILSGDGEAEYVLGVTDDGGLAGVSQATFAETMDVLSLLADEAGAHIADVQTWGIDSVGDAPAGTDGIVGVATVQDGDGLAAGDDHIIVGTAGHVDHGKSTLVGSLVTGDADDGDGATRGFLDVQPHEVERGLSADLSYGVYGFDGDGPLRVRNPDRKDERAAVVEAADRVVSFVDTVGHEPWLSTTIRGLVGQKLDYGLLTVAADDGPTKTTREHMGVLLATELPTIVAVTKTDLVDDDRVAAVEREVEALLRRTERAPLPVARHGVDAAVDELGDGVVPIVRTSAVTGDGLAVLDELFARLPKTTAASGPFRMYVDRTYSVTGVGAVASGTVKSGTVEDGETLLLGPFPNGSFRTVEVRSIEMHYHRVDSAQAGRIVGIALKGVSEEAIERGMVLLPGDADPTPVRAFDAEVMVLNHPTRIDAGYEPVVHLETIGEAARFTPADGQLLPGDAGHTRVRFKFRPYLVEEGQRFVFREGSSKGVGTVTDVVE